MEINVKENILQVNGKHKPELFTGGFEIEDRKLEV